MNTAWMDLYGETPDEPEKECYGCGKMQTDGECLNPDCKLCEKGDENIWCKVCECWVKKTSLKRWTGDDQLHFLCDGCDSDLLPIQSIPAENWLHKG
jgi:hypothetical protein